MLGVTLAVAGAPIALVWSLRASGAVSSPLIGIAIGMAVSLLVSQLGCRLWGRRDGSGDVLFSELLLWGFLQRRRSERRLASALAMLGTSEHASDAPAAGGLSTRRQARLLERLVAAVETRDRYLHGHSQRVARLSWMVARRLGLPRAEVTRIRTAAALHDVGKINTPTAILHKPGRLTDEEFAVIKRHPDDGAEMAAVLRDPGLTAIVRHHHERLDGSGYPAGLTGESIPIGARIVAVVDTFDAITSVRPYRPARPHREALEILRAEAGVKLDAKVVRAFCAHYSGRRSVALWSFLASAGDRLLAWAGAGAGGAASAARTLAVAALVGSAAATTSALAFPASHGSARGALARAAGSRRLAASAASSSFGRRSASRGPAGTPIIARPARAGAPATSGVGAAGLPAAGAGAGGAASGAAGATASASVPAGVGAQAMAPPGAASAHGHSGTARNTHSSGGGVAEGHRGRSRTPGHGGEATHDKGMHGASGLARGNAPAGAPGAARHEASSAPGASGGADEAHGGAVEHASGGAQGEAHGSGEAYGNGGQSPGGGQGEADSGAGKAGSGAPSAAGHGGGQEARGGEHEPLGGGGEAHGSGAIVR